MKSTKSDLIAENESLKKSIVHFKECLHWSEKRNGALEEIIKLLEQIYPERKHIVSLHEKNAECRVLKMVN